ncbi:hypothetical protein QAD02_021952 [Eretmocerus hayati]|uniref:Uncharacterized protein n=1 Tax=Eretmocerus hayati TaxID=131215 RepID=A0ACC2PT39_9HYME|nr:hypothetical protein QAD02_021952 [Eretmocerus hayati]
MASPAPKSPEQSEKSRKYDRQLRLWNDHGQAMLEDAHVCLINANALGTEILKSLILPGIGAFTIVDGHKVTEEDIGSNFFLEADSTGKSRAEVTTQLLLELNPDVSGDFIDEGPEQLLNNSPDFFNNFSIVIACSISEKALVLLSKKLWEIDVPLVVCKSLGFIGYIRVQIKEHTIVETHPDNEIPDLRLDKPFEALKNHFDAIDFDSLDLKDHSHTPYVTVLYKYLQKWLLNHPDLPINYREKDEFKQMIRDGIRKDADDLDFHEENFEEAIRAVNTCIRHTTVNSSLKEILSDNSCVNLNSKSQTFWIIVKAIRDFMENEGNNLPPVRGALPDMVSDTDKFVSLQQIYHKQAQADVEAVWRRTLQLLRELGKPSDSILEKDVKLYCRHASELCVQRGTSIADEYDPKLINTNEIAQSLENPESMMIHYVMLRGVEKFQMEYNTYPGEFDDHVEPDIVKLKACVSKLLNEWGCGPLSKDDYVHEFCRYGGAEIHTVSASIGGMAAQEVIKIITHQYTPIYNTYIYDASLCRGTTLFF